MYWRDIGEESRYIYMSINSLFNVYINPPPIVYNSEMKNWFIIVELNDIIYVYTVSSVVVIYSI